MTRFGRQVGEWIKLRTAMWLSCLATTHKCLARSNKFRTGSNAIMEAEPLRSANKQGVE